MFVGVQIGLANVNQAPAGATACFFARNSPYTAIRKPVFGGFIFNIVHVLAPVD
jgi:hypothetical protein